MSYEGSNKRMQAFGRGHDSMACFGDFMQAYIKCSPLFIRLNILGAASL